MSKIHLLLLDEDTQYTERLAAFIHSSEFADQLQPKLFTKTENVEKHLEAERSACILLVSEGLLPKCFPNRENVCVLTLSRFLHPIERSDTESNTPCLLRFQPLEQLLHRVLAYYQEKHKDHLIKSKNMTQVVSIYAAIGNCGKTLTAIHLARELAFRGKKVLYLSLEAPSFAAQLLKEADPQHFSQILYYMKSKPELFKAKLDLFMKNDPRFGFDYVSPCHHVREAQEMSADETRLLIETLITMNSYDYIVLDLEASLHARIYQALKLSDFTLWLILDDLNCLHKTKSIQKILCPPNSTHYVLNKYTGAVFNDFQSADIPISGHLPYMPEWKAVHAQEQIISSSIFSDQVMRIFEASVLSHREGALV